MCGGKTNTIGFVAICFLRIEIMRQLPSTARAVVLPGDHDHDSNGRKLDVLAACKVSTGFRTTVIDFLDHFHALHLKHTDHSHRQETSALQMEGTPLVMHFTTIQTILQCTSPLSVVHFTSIRSALHYHP